MMYKERVQNVVIFEIKVKTNPISCLIDYHNETSVIFWDQGCVLMVLETLHFCLREIRAL